jgi:hypothetical protein
MCYEQEVHIMHNRHLCITNVLKLCVVLGVGLTCASLYSLEFGTPQREFSIVATKEGFYPKKLAFFVGEKIHLYLTTTQKSSCFVFDPQGIFVGMRKGELVETTVYFDRPGVFKFYCPAGKTEGEFVVLAPKKKSVSKCQRDIASMPNTGVNIWMPAIDEEVGK